MVAVSIIIPTYNAEKTILETVHSIQRQTFQDFEIIIINDGSTDETLNILEQVLDERLKVFSYKNGGVSLARNRGIALAQGEFLAFIDQDDLWTSDKLERQLAALQHHPDAGAAYSWTTNMLSDGTSLSFSNGGCLTFEGNIYPELLLSNFIGSGSNILVRREVVNSIGFFNETLPTFADWDFYLRIAAQYHFVVVPKYQILYRKTPGSMSSKVATMINDGLCMIEYAYQSAPPDLQHLKKQSIAFLYRYCADLALKNNLDKKNIQFAQEKLWLAIKLYPQLLQEKYAQRLIAELLLKRLLPGRVFNFLVRPIRKNLSFPDPRLQP
ncbi:MAG TPA: glycosyltransferase family A protein [Coleofasciculaceae cyanobacterium]|jgi:glycosyltransferase involved in cell wall biosynthesis